MTLGYSASVRAERARYSAAAEAVAEDRRRRRAAVMGLLAQGDLTASESADMLGVTPRTIWRWCKAAGINPKQARRDLLARLGAVAHLFAPLFDQMMRDRNPNPKSNP